jgi:CpeT protein
MKKQNLFSMMAIATLLLTTINITFVEAKPRNSYKISNKQVQEVVKHLTGIMDTTQQAATNPKAPSVRMTTCKVTVNTVKTMRKPVIYLYQEQALTNKLEKPYRQRFLRISPSKNNTIESAGFKPLNPEKLINLCNQPDTERTFKMEEIGKSECSVFLKKQGNDYIGETQKGGCPSNYKGAVKITNKIILHSTGMDTFDRGYDANGKILWGAKNEPYQFRWLNQTNSK